MTQRRSDVAAAFFSLLFLHIRCKPRITRFGKIIISLFISFFGFLLLLKTISPLRSMKFALAVVTVAVLAHCAAASDSDFAKCFCFQENGNWCSTTTPEGETDFMRDSCKNWLTTALLWTIPAFVVFLGFAVFPFVFCCARVCCNCCGGREPSDGCCCPSQSSTRVHSDGSVEVIPKAYSNRSIFCTKFMYAACFALWVYYSVGVFVINHRVNNAFMDVTGAIATQSSLLYDTVLQAQNVTQQLADSGATFMDAQGVAEQLQASANKYHTVDSDIQKIINHLQDAETQQQYGRYADAFRIPAVPMIILFPVLLLMLCNVRGAVMTISAGLLAVTALFVVASFIVHELVAQGSTALCNNYNSTLVPSLINAAIYGGGCGLTTVSAELNLGAANFFQQACADGISDMCFNGGPFNCPPSAYESLCLQSSSGMNAEGWSPLMQLLNATFEQSVTYSDPECSSSGCSIQQCAAMCSNGDLKGAAMKVTSFMQSYYSNTAELMTEFLPDYVNCSAIYTALISPSIQGELCGDFSTEFTNIAIQFLALSVLCIPTTILLILGAKRFTKMQPLPDGASMSNPSTFTYRVLLQTDDERAVMGSPLLGEQPQGYYTNAAPTGYGAANVATPGIVVGIPQPAVAEPQNVSMCTVVN